jgi:predicted RNA-binding Zn-ribbon protein involved in translation (DUF1610 family)
MHSPRIHGVVKQTTNEERAEQTDLHCTTTGHNTSYRRHFYVYQCVKRGKNTVNVLLQTRRSPNVYTTETLWRNSACEA